MTDTTKEAAERRRGLLALARIYRIDLVALGTTQPDGSVMLDWDRLQEAVTEAQTVPDESERP